MRQERQGHPFVIAGGRVPYCEPLADFLDLVVMGEGRSY